MTKFFTITAFTVLGVVVGGSLAWAQEPGATCKPLDEAGCRAASACRWTAPKVLALPNGSPVNIPGACKFKPGVASALKAAAAATK